MGDRNLRYREPYVTYSLGLPVTTTISLEGEIIVYSGIFSDNAATYTLRLNPDNTFSYAQELLLILEDGTYSCMTVSTVSGTRVDSDYRGTGTVLVHQSSGGALTGFKWEYEIKCLNNGGWVGLLRNKLGEITMVSTALPSYNDTTIAELEAIVTTDSVILLERDTDVWSSIMDEVAAQTEWALH